MIYLNSKSICFLFLASIQFVACSQLGGCNGEHTVEGISWIFDSAVDSVNLDVNTLEDCAGMCQMSSNCSAYTWQDEGPLSLCYIFAEVRGRETCFSCISGVPNVRVPGGACAGDFDHILGEASANSSAVCVGLCEQTDECSYITWFNASSIFENTCFMYSTCDEVRPCDDCESWQISCVPGEECFGQEYFVLNDTLRNVNGPVTDNTTQMCDQMDQNSTSFDWMGPGFYKVEGPAGSGIAKEAPGYGACGTELSGYISGMTLIMVKNNHRNLKLK